MGLTKDNRQKIVSKYLKNPNLGPREIGRQLGLPKSTVSDVIKRFKETNTVERQRAGGRKPGVVNQSLASKVIKFVKKKPTATEREMAQKYGVSQSWIHKVVVSSGLKAFRVQKKANRNDQQALRAKRRARKLYDRYLRGKKSCVILDDETYCVADFKQLPGRGFYRSFKRFGVAKQFKYQGLTKFPKKYLVWQSICSCGRRSVPYIAKGNMKTDTYVKECLQKRLLPFIRSHDENTLFWPDLASIHYGSQALVWYRSNNVEVVPKEANPPNCPELRPIETYWALIKQKLRKSGKMAKNYKSFAKLWAAVTKKISDGVVKQLMKGLAGKVHRFSRQPIDD